MVKRNTLNIISIRTHEWSNLLNQTSKNRTGNFTSLFPNRHFLHNAGGRVVLSETSVVGGKFSLSSSSSSRMGFFAELSIAQLSNAVGEKMVPMPGLKTASTTS